MIVPMIKYNVVLYHADVLPFLNKLQELGVADVRRSNRAVDEQSAKMMEEIARYTAAYKLLSKVSTNDPEADDTQHDHPSHIMRRAEELWEERGRVLDRQAQLRLEIEVSRPWGHWDTAPVDKLQDIGIAVHFYKADAKKYDEAWEKEYVLKVINREDNYVYFAVLEVPGEPYNFPLTETRLPQASVAVLETELDNISVRLQTIASKLAKYALQRHRLEQYRSELTEQLDIYLSGKGAQAEAENTLSVITAFVPAPQNAAVVEFLDKEQVVYLAADAAMEDNPPVKLKNNRFARLFEPIGDMFMPPMYNELDVTAFFSPFYMLFFGFCLGDIGYGLVLLLLGTVAKRFVPKMRSILSLVQFLGLGSIIMPLFSGTFFGMKIGELFKIEDVFFDDLQMFWLAIAFGGLQIIIAKIIHAIDSMKRQGWQHGLAHLGWALLLVDAALLVGHSILLLPIPMPVILTVFYVGIALVLFFTNQSKNIFVRVAKGVASFYDVTAIFGDLLSYIRLFGLGTAGGILGFVVNTVGAMCWQVSYVGWLIGGIVFVVGHIAVLALSSLGAFVHPMRLTFVEFYKNVGFTGGGRYYKPLRKGEG